MYSNRSFYVTLPSNVQSLTDKKNVTSEYTTYLPKALELQNNDWECALVEISYPHSFNNIHPPFDLVKFSWWDNDTKTQIKQNIRISNGYYNSIDDVLEIINSEKPKGFRGMFGFEKKGRKKTKIVLFTFESIELHSTLARLLGFKEEKWSYIPSHTTEEERLRIKADFIADIRALHYNFFIYSSIIQPHLCGTEYLPLLRTVNVEGSEGSYISKVYEIPHYLPLSSNFIESLDIKITDDLGQNIQFQYGKVIIKLHFRRRGIF